MSNRKSVHGILLSILFVFIALMISCEQPEADVPQLNTVGTISGTVSIPEGADVKPEDLWVKVVSEGVTENVSHVKSDGTFLVKNLNETKKYNVYISSDEPGQENYRDLQPKVKSTSGFGGWLGNVTANGDRGNIKIKPLGTIKGKVTFSDRDEHFDIDVYIPGTSYIAITAKDGSFSIFNVPQGEHTVRCSKEGYIAKMVEGVKLISDSDTESPEAKIDPVTLIRNTGTLYGTIHLKGETVYSGIDIKVQGENATGKELGKTTQKGEFSIPEIAPGTYSILITKDGYQDMMVEGIEIRAGEETPLKEVVTLIKKNSNVTGTVTLKGQESHDGIAILLNSADGAGRSYKGSTDKDGKFVINGVEPGSYYLLASKTGYASSNYIDVFVESDKTTTVDAQELSSATRSVYGSVQHTDGTPFEGVDVTATHNSERKVIVYGQSNEKGDFTLSGMKPGTYTLVFNLDGFQSVRLTGVAVEENEELHLDPVKMMRANGDINGELAFGKRPVPETVTVSIRNINDNAIGDDTIVGKDGKFHFTEMVPGVYDITVKAENYKTIEDQVEVKADTAVSFSAEMKRSVGNIEGTVTNKAGNPVEGAEIRFKNEYSPMQISKTAANGTFSFKDVQPGTYSLSILLDKHETIEKLVEIKADETFVYSAVMMSSVGNLSGIISDKTSKPISGLNVSISKKDVQEKLLKTGEDGSFLFLDLEPGVYSVMVSGVNYVTINDSVEVTAGITTSYTKQIAKSVGCLSGKLTDKSGNPVTGANINLSAEGMKTYLGVTNGEGVYSIDDILPGTYTVSITKAGYVDIKDTVTVIADSEAQYDAAAVKNAGMITGTVTMSGASDNTGIQVSVRNIASGKTYPAVLTDKNGAYSVYDIDEEGEYSVSFVKEGYLTDSTQTVSVSFGNTSKVSSVKLNSIFAAISGKVTLEENASHLGISILIKAQNADGSFVSKNTETDQDGNFTIDSVLPGTYTLYASMPGYESKVVKDIKIEASEKKVMEQTIVLPVGIRSVTGLVKLELKSDHSGALVTATNTSDRTKVYSAITNTEGRFTLAGMVSGQYNIVVSYPKYNAVTPPTVDVQEGHSKDIGTIEVSVARGTITGAATLNKWSDHSGITVELMKDGKVYETKKTSSTGAYSFYVPEGNYSGVRLSRTDFATLEVSRNIAIFAGGTAPVGNNNLIATHMTIKGNVDIAAKESDANVRVTIDGLDGFSGVSSADGSFVIEHVPVDRKEYVLRYTLENAPEVTKTVETEPAEFIDAGKIKLIPRSATLCGVVTLDGKTNHSGIKVTASSSDNTCVESTVTDESGSFRIPNVISTGTYTVVFEKNGWNTASVSGISDLKPLDTVDITASHTVCLTDTTAPVIVSVVLGSGANTTTNRDIIMTLDVADTGSGVRRMQYSYGEVFDETAPIGIYSYKQKITLPKDNGLKTVKVRVQDNSGNWSAVSIVQVKLNGQMHEIKNDLSGDDLHWTYADSPYLVTGNVHVLEGSELIIDPGVDIVWGGAYQMYVEGTISARGTAEQPIDIYSSSGATGNINTNGKGEVNIDHAVIKNTTFYGYGNFNHLDWRGDFQMGRGSLLNSKIQPAENSDYTRISLDSSTVQNCMLQAEEVHFFFASVSYTTISNAEKEIGTAESIITYSTFNNCCPQGWFIDTGNIKNSNIIDCGTLTLTNKKEGQKVIALTGNYWGEKNTYELQTRPAGENDLSFIVDYYDGDFSRPKADISGYKAVEIKGAGYQGDNFQPIVPETGYKIGDVGPGGGFIFYVDEKDEFPAWTYMEVYINPNVFKFCSYGYYRDPVSNESVCVGTSDAFGSGKENTEKLVAAMGEEAYLSAEGNLKGTYAAKIVSDFVNNGCDDWFLPSKEEMKTLYNNLAPLNIRPLSEHYYWTSSEQVPYDSVFAGDADYSGISFINVGRNYPYTRPVPVRTF